MDTAFLPSPAETGGFLPSPAESPPKPKNTFLPSPAESSPVVRGFDRKNAKLEPIAQNAMADTKQKLGRDLTPDEEDRVRDRVMQSSINPTPHEYEESQALKNAGDSANSLPRSIAQGVFNFGLSELKPFAPAAAETARHARAMDAPLADTLKTESGQIVGSAVPTGLALTTGVVNPTTLLTAQGAIEGVGRGREEAAKENLGTGDTIKRVAGNAITGGVAGAAGGELLGAANELATPIERVAANAIGGATIGAGQTIAENQIARRPVETGVKQAMKTGGATQGLFASAGEVARAFLPSPAEPPREFIPSPAEKPIENKSTEFIPSPADVKQNLQGASDAIPSEQSGQQKQPVAAPEQQAPAKQAGQQQKAGEEKGQVQELPGHGNDAPAAVAWKPPDNEFLPSPAEIPEPRAALNRGAVSLPGSEEFVGKNSFIGQDVVPHAAAVGKAVLEAKDDIQKTFAPASRGDKASMAANILRESGANLAQRSNRAHDALAKASKLFQSKSNPENLAFIDAMEHGQTLPDPQLQPIAHTFRTMLDERRQQVQDLGTGKLEHFIQDYFPHLWADPEKASQVMSQIVGKRPMEGSKGFLKQRTIPTVAEGVAKGLEPLSYNPVDLALLKVREMDRYILAQKSLAEMKDKKLVQFVSADDRPPEGYAQINDKIATVYGPRQGGVKLPSGANIEPNDVQVYGQRVMGRYYAPQEVAQVINNYLSPGLRGKAWFRGYQSIGNAMNQVQLGISAFHIGTTTWNSITSRAALGLQQLADGQPIEAAKSLITLPIAPFSNMLKGSKILNEWIRPGSEGAAIARIADEVVSAGGRVKQDQFYRTDAADNMMRAFRSGNMVGDAIRFPFAVMEKFAAPVFEKFVPRLKLGAFSELARFEMGKLGMQKFDEDAVRGAMSKAWDSIDNRFGQVVYDNLFWNKTVKDVAMASTRSLGWNLGTLRELGGGVKDIAAGVGKAAMGKGFELSPRAAYTIALPLMTGITGGMFHYLMTGEAPKELKDYFYPKTGEKDAQGNDVRVSLPSYMKDFYSYWEHPKTTIANKAHPLINTIVDMLANKDYYGTQVRNADDPIMKQAMDNLKFVGKQFVPFTLRGAQQLSDPSQPTSKKVLPFVGITPAPRSITQTPFEKMVEEFHADQIPAGARTQVQAEHSQLKNQMSQSLRNKEPASLNKLMQAVKDNKLSEREAKEIMSDYRLTPAARQFKQLPLDRALKAWQVASPQERDEVRQEFFGKIQRYDKRDETYDAAVKALQAKAA